MFLLDKSGSVGSNNFKTTLGFVESAVNFFDVGQLPGQSRVGVATFSSSSRHNVEFHLDSQNSKEEALAAIRGIRYTGALALLCAAPALSRRLFSGGASGSLLCRNCRCSASPAPCILGLLFFFLGVAGR